LIIVGSDQLNAFICVVRYSVVSSTGNTGSDNTFWDKLGCPNVYYNLCAGCDSNICDGGVEGDVNSDACNGITGCNTKWGLETGDSFEYFCWRELCCGDDVDEYYKQTSIGGSIYEGCCDTSTDCVDAQGNCQNELNEETTCNDAQDNDCDGDSDCDDTNCEESDYCINCDNDDDCPDNWICIDDFCTSDCIPPCPAGYRCTNRICMELQSCWSNHDCPDTCICDRPYCDCPDEE